jgi:hypothetical protein
MMADWWPRACETQSWREGDRELRLRVMSLAVSLAFTSQKEFLDALTHYSEHAVKPGFRDLESANELSITTDVDAVKRVLLMLADDLNGADEVGHPEHGAARRHRDVIRDQVKCLAIYPLGDPMGQEGAWRMVLEMANDKFNKNRRIEQITLDEVSDQPVFFRNKHTGKMQEGYSQLEQLVMTVARVLNGKTGFRARAGHSMHDMLTSAGLPCACKACCQPRILIPALQPEPDLENEPF